MQKVLGHRRYSSPTQYDVLLMSPPPLDEGLLTSWLGDVFEYETGIKKSTALKKWYREIAARYEIGFLDAGEFCDTSKLDGVHMDDDNQKKLGDAVAEYVRSMLK